MAGYFKPNNGEINRTLHSPGGIVYDFLNAYGQRVETIAKRRALVDTGALRASIKATKPHHGPSGLELVVGSDNDHALVIHQGHKIIRRKTSKYLTFQPKDLRASGKYVSTKKVRAVGGVPFLTDALIEANITAPSAVRFSIVIRKKPNPAPPPRGSTR